MPSMSSLRVLALIAALLLSPVMAAAAMALSSVSVIGNALRLRAVDMQIDPTAKAYRSRSRRPRTARHSAPRTEDACGTGIWPVPLSCRTKSS